MTRRRMSLGAVTENYDALRRPVRAADRRPGDIPYYGASGVVDFIDGHLFDGEYLLIAEDGENLRSRNTPIAFLATGRFWVNNHAHVVRGNHLADTRYLCHLLATMDLSGYLSGSTLPKLTQAAMNSIQIELPSRDAQSAVAEVLGAFDDKIAANSSIAGCVDRACQARFEQLTCGAPLAELRKYASVNEETARPGPHGLRYLDISCVSTGKYSWPKRSPWSDAPGRARRKLRLGDTVWSTVRPNRRSHALILDNDDELIGSTGLVVLTPRNVGPAFLYEATKLPGFTAYLEGVAEGSAYPAVRAERFLQAPVPAATDEVGADFERMAMPLRLRAHTATAESRHLAELRDTLLPHLMSGRLSVRQAEQVVSDVL